MDNENSKPLDSKPKKIKGINKRYEIERERRKPIVVEFKLMGSNFSQIARIVKDKLGLKKVPSYHTIEADWALIQEEWKNERVQTIQEYKDAELKAIDHLILVCYNAWIKSFTDNELKQVKKKGFRMAGSITTKEIEDLTKQNINFGNVAFLAEIRANQNERRKILGIYSAEKKEIKTEDTGLGINNLNKEDKMKLAEMLLKYKKPL